MHPIQHLYFKRRLEVEKGGPKAMGKSVLPPVHILVTPLGATVDIIEAPLDKWKPEVIYAFTSMEDAVTNVLENLRYDWSRHCGPNGPPEVRTVHIDKPWQTNTIEDVMAEFDEMVERTSIEFSKREIIWHVSITGGTNLLAIGMALSASTHLFPVYYTLPGDKYPELRSKPSQLVIDIPLFDQLGPAVRLFRKSPAKVELFRLIDDSPEPLVVERIAKEMDKSQQAIYAQITPLIECGVLEKKKNSTYHSTTVGKLAYHRWKGNGPS